MSELALKLIEENKKTRATFLDLGNCGLTEVPAEIGELVWLEGLSFSSEWRDDSGWKVSQNTGSANNIKRLKPSVSGFSNIKRLLGGMIVQNPFSRLLNLKRLWLNDGFRNKFDRAYAKYIYASI
jgi:hypothetical protein